jgi:UDP-GlcNAc:undecaprenyl-phosphate GlcNAc-1-phosphate transferase
VLLALLLTALIGGVLSLILTRLAMFLAPRLAFLDRPGAEAHKQQARAIPYGGGPAMAVALAVALPVGLWVFAARPNLIAAVTVDHGPLWPVFVGAAVLLGLGAIDDRRPLRARPKLVVQAAVCALAVWGSDLAIDSLRPWPVLAYGLAWGWLVVVSNAYNLLDHADGMAAGCALISAVVLLSGSLWAGDVTLALLWMALIAVLGGYLWWNRPPARVYMGDAGSLPLGFLIGVGTLSVTFWPAVSGGGSPFALATPFLITAIPLFDTAVVVIKRLRRHRPLMQGDRHHISHRLSRLGLRPAATLATVLSLHLALAISAMQLRSGDSLSGSLVVLQAVAVLAAVLLLETSRDHGPSS